VIYCSVYRSGNDVFRFLTATQVFCGFSTEHCAHFNMKPALMQAGSASNPSTRGASKFGGTFDVRMGSFSRDTTPAGVWGLIFAASKMAKARVNRGDLAITTKLGRTQNQVAVVESQKLQFLYLAS
jgi:hypothetical protein